MSHSGLLSEQKARQPARKNSAWQWQPAALKLPTPVAQVANLPGDFARIPSSSSPCPATPQRCPFGGACHTCPTRVQPKLTISQPGDAYEQEADRVADMVMRMPVPEMDDKEECIKPGCPPAVQRQASDSASLTGVPPIVHEVLRSPGQPLDPATRAFMEPRFGHDFDQVRVHTDAKAAESAQAVDAQAYTVGGNMVFGHGLYAPGISKGRRLIAHELAHVVQQTDQTESLPTALVMGDEDVEYLHEAKRSRNRIAIGGGPAYELNKYFRKSPMPVIMRTHIFTSTMEICRWLLKSRVFHVSEGGIVVTANASWEASQDWQGEESPRCGSEIYNMTLNKRRLILDSEYGSCEFGMGRPVSRTWTNLPEGDYYLTIWTLNTNPNCCLRGDIEVSQERGLGGETCTRPPPGPLEILHDALAIAGLIPALGVIPDAIDAAVYLIQGEWANAGLSAVAIVPIFGEAASVGRIGRRTVVRVSGDAVEQIGHDAIVTGLREARASQRTIVSEIDDTVERAFSEGRVSRGELLELVEYGGASRARQVRGQFGRQIEAAHGAPQAAMRGVVSYDPNVALTRLLPKHVHRDMDRFWQSEARRLGREGRMSWTAQEMFNAVSESIQRTRSLSDSEKFSHIQRLADEVFVEHGLSPSSLVRLPFL